jgi:transposase
VKAESALSVLAFNMIRVVNTVGTGALARPS